jgi:uncharacterized protein (TIGR03086 family)
MEPLDALALATSTFVALLDQVGDDQWDVRSLVRHVVMGNEMAVALLDGASQEEARSFIDKEYDGDLDVLCRASLEDQLARMGAVTDWDVIVHHAIGDVPASQLIGFRTGDLALHGWDLATAVHVADGAVHRIDRHVRRGSVRLGRRRCRRAAAPLGPHRPPRVSGGPR